MTFFESDEYKNNKDSPETLKKEKNYNKMIGILVKLLIVIFGVLLFQVYALVALEMNV